MIKRTLISFLFFYLICLLNARADAFEVTASPSIEPSLTSNYAPKNLKDMNLQTAWCSNLKISEMLWLDVSYSTPISLSGFGFVNGYAKNQIVYRNNARPKNITVSVDGKAVSQVRLADIDDPQWVEFKPVNGKDFKFIIKEFYDGLKYDDVCIAEVFDDTRIVRGCEHIKIIDKKFGNRALTTGEIKQHLKPLYDDLYHPHYDGNGSYDVNAFWYVVQLRASRLDERGLRLLYRTRYPGHKIKLMRLPSVDAHCMPAAGF